MSEGIDRRAVRTKKALKCAMFELLKKKDISRITVSELADLADIGRGTFYLHYTDPYDLLDQVENEVLEQIITLDAPVLEKWRYTNMLSYLEQIWQHVYDNQEQFKILMNHQHGMRFMSKFKSYGLKEAMTASNIDNLNDTEQAYTICYIINGTLGMFQKWMDEGTVIPPNRLAQIARNVIGGQ